MDRNARTVAVLMALFILAAGSFPSGSRAQSMGQFTSASIAPDGEGGPFMSAGKDRFRTGIFSRFRLGSRSDLGFQGGFDRVAGVNSYGGGADFKLYLLDTASTLPVDLAAMVSIGHFRTGGSGWTVAGISVLASGMLVADTEVPIEPYASFGFYTTFLPGLDDCDTASPLCGDSGSNDTDSLIRGGLKVWFSDEYQLVAEVGINGNTTFGAGINVVF